MVLDVEDLVREQHGREYIVMPETGVAISDFIRQPIQVPYREQNVDLASNEVAHLIRNGRYSSAHRLAGSVRKTVCISGEVDFPAVYHDEYACIGVHRGIFSSVAAYSFILDPMGETIKELRKNRRLPLGIFDIRSSSQTISEWERRSRVGVYRHRPGKSGCDGVLAKGISCHLQEDPLASAMQYAAQYMGSLDVFLHAADRSYAEPMEGFNMRSLGSRWILAEHQRQFDILFAVAMILQRNGVNVYVTRDTMVEVPGAKVIDREELPTEILHGLSEDF